MASAFAKIESPAYLLRMGPDCRSWDEAAMQRSGPAGSTYRVKPISSIAVTERRQTGDVSGGIKGLAA